MSKHRAPEYVINALERALDAAKLKPARFGMTHEKIGKTTKDAFIKEETRLFRQSWLIPEIEIALIWATGNTPRKKP